MKKINHSQPHIDDKDLRSLTDSIKTGWLAHGKNNKIFGPLPYSCSFYVIVYFQKHVNDINNIFKY